VSGSLLERGEGCHSPSGAGVTNRSSTVAVPRSSTVPDRKDGPHSDDSFIIAPAYEGYMLRVSRVCDALEFPMSHDNQSGILRLHSHRTLADDGAPQMTEAWLTRLNRNSSGLAADDKGEGDAATLDDLDVDRKEAALARLRDDYALLYGVVYLTDLRGLSLRETGRHLRLDHKTVKRHRAKGVAYVRALCNEERRAG